ncbi:hypothetical protein C2G38_2231897 [Gigaspora rosea]|uniref:Uncharacterized protein n=1 Tax=Gigaspora rosea TaxID=44941 RepID=A0A397U122_9GLOM|nr:hypothetical protein C2G38_2231897 [Gigaspora rosea]
MNNDTIFRYVLYKLNDIDLAITYCNSAIKNNETNVIAIGIRGKSYYLSNLFEEALEDFHKVLEIFPNKAILKCCGETYQKLKKYKKSLQNNKQSHGETYRLIGKYNEALANFNKLLEIEPDNELALGKRSETYFIIEKYNEALTDLNEYMKKNRLSSKVIGNRAEKRIRIKLSHGATYNEMDRYMELLKQLNDSLEIEPNNVDALGKRGAIYRVMEDYEKALEDLNRAVKINMNNAFVLKNNYKVAWALRKRGELIVRWRAIDDFNKSLEIMLNNAWSRKAYCFMEKYEEGISDLTPNNAWALRNREEAFCKIGLYEKSLADLNESLNFDPSSEFALNKYEEAFDDLKKSLEIEPNNKL